ncbi:hypothetical protein HU200_000908 [Digitaria exilis]|uniref:Eukaryotic translation initiation factor 3 subunit B n=1 Tax=Digitaria exilis TaxID=1010633 RepID=A0A835L0J2_9POAL|nr:hypothetical protein HU200_000908 [Digitaria exilis]
MDGIEARARELGIDLYSVDLDTITLPAGEDSSILSDDDDDDEILNNENLPELEMGYANTIVEAELAKEEGNGRKLDKSHSLVVNIFDDFERYKKVPDEWMPPEIKPYTRGENLQRWITDEKARDQFVIRLVWGGTDKFERLMRFAHPQRVVLNIFDVRTGKLMRGFKGTTDEFTTGGDIGFSGVPWPFFSFLCFPRWGGGKDDKYFARLGKNVISVYETDTFSLIDKKSLKVESVLDFCWSPTDPIIALFVPEMGGGNQPARVCLVDIPGKEELRQKNLFGVSDCKMYWQNNGEYLAVQVDRYTKTNKTTYSGFELFRIKEKDIPIEVLELDNKSTRVIAFAWEPNGHRFAVIHGDDHRPDISFYSMQTANNPCRVSKLITLKSKEANALYWCPSGRFILLAGLKGFNGKLEFYNVDALETMSTTDHLMATDTMWDPTGRYVATAITSVHEMENGFHIWSFNGKLLYKVLKDNFFQFLWRPRPQSLLASEKEEEISRNLKKYSKRYEQEDQVTFNQLSELQHKKQKQLQEEWDAWVAKWKQQHKEERELRVELRDGEASDEKQAYEAKEVEMDEVVEIKEEVVTFELGQE